jgi:hypothetical protein
MIYLPLQEQLSQQVYMQIKPSNPSGYLCNTGLNTQKTYVLYSECIYIDS